WPCRWVDTSAMRAVSIATCTSGDPESLSWRRCLAAIVLRSAARSAISIPGSNGDRIVGQKGTPAPPPDQSSAKTQTDISESPEGSDGFYPILPLTGVVPQTGPIPTVDGHSCAFCQSKPMPTLSTTAPAAPSVPGPAIADRVKHLKASVT